MLTARYLEHGEDSATWGVTPAYQVEFWTHLASNLPDTAPEKVGYKKDAYLLTDATDVREVTAWADEHAEGRIVVIYAVIRDRGDGHGRGLFHLSGLDPTHKR